MDILEKDGGICYLRLFNALAHSVEIDVYINGDLVEGSFVFGVFTEFWRIKPGVYNIIVKPKGSEESLYEDLLEFLENHVYNLAVVGEDKSRNLPIKFAILSDSLWHDTLRPNISFANLTDYEKNIDISLDNNKVVADLCFRDLSHSLEVKPKTYDISIHNDEKSLFDGKIDFEASKTYFAFVVFGDVDSVKLIVSDEFPIA